MAFAIFADPQPLDGLRGPRPNFHHYGFGSCIPIHRHTSLYGRSERDWIRQARSQFAHFGQEEESPDACLEGDCFCVLCVPVGRPDERQNPLSQGLWETGYRFSVREWERMFRHVEWKRLGFKHSAPRQKDPLAIIR